MRKLLTILKNYFPTLEIHNFLDLTISMLKYVGFEIEDSYNGCLFYWLVVINLTGATISSGASIFSKPFDIEKITYGLPVVASTLMIILKSIVLFINKDKILMIMNELKSINQEQGTNSSKMFTKFFYGYLLSLLSPLIVNIMTPIVKILVSGEKTFPLDMKFPVDVTNNFIYPLVLLWTYWNLINGFIIFFATDVLLYSFIRIISIEFETLQHSFENLNISETSDELKTLICHQNELYDACIKLERIFSITFFYKFIISSFVICFTAFQCSTSSDTSKILVNMTICIANFNQIGLQCFFGQMLKNASENVTNSIYNCQWENSTNMNVKRLLIVCIARSNRHVALTTLKFSEITFEQLTYVSS
ncbi:hypothetical protein ACKWTF_005846 [Chironomus riparius]